MTKLRFWDRILSAVMGLLCVAAAAAIGLYAFGKLPVQQMNELLQKIAVMDWKKWLIYGAAVLVLLLVGIHGIGMLFRRRKDKGFVVQRTEFGDMSISMKAMENMVKKCVDAHGELSVNNTRIYLVRGGVSIDMKITLASGVNIPLTVNALQKQIKQYITSCSGVDVHEVRVKVETDNVKLLPPPQTPVVEPEGVEEAKLVEEPAGREYQYKDEPVEYVQPASRQEEATAPVKAEEPAVNVTENEPEEPAEQKAEEEQPETVETSAEEIVVAAEEANA